MTNVSAAVLLLLVHACCFNLRLSATAAVARVSGSQPESAQSCYWKRYYKPLDPIVWIPERDKYLFALCFSGRMSNQVSAAGQVPL